MKLTIQIRDRSLCSSNLFHGHCQAPRWSRLTLASCNRLHGGMFVIRVVTSFIVPNDKEVLDGLGKATPPREGLRDLLNGNPRESPIAICS